MRALRLAIAAFFIAIATPVGAALPQLALACGSAPAGQDVPCTISRVAGGRGVYVLLQTSDGTAKAGTDYAAVSRQVYLSAGTPSLSLAVHTFVNSNATGTLTFNAALAGGAAVVRAVGSIVEPPPPPPATQTCPDGSVVAFGTACPAPRPPPPPPAPAPGTAIALQACPSLMNPADALTIGASYTVVGYAHQQQPGDPPTTLKDVVILNDASHRGDGWFGLYVPIGCVTLGP